MICCFTGPRPKHFKFKYNENHSDCKHIKELLRTCINFAIDAGYNHFITGMALGVDQWAAEIVIELREFHPNIKLEAAIPCKNHDGNWPTEFKERYNNILDECDIINRVSRLPYSGRLMIERDYYMVNKSDLLIATYGGVGQGTKVTFEYALKNDKLILEIDPINFIFTTHNLGDDADETD